MGTLHATVTAYKGLICIELHADKSIEGEVTTSLDNPGAFGQIVHNTKEHLGVSAEAIELLKLIKGRSSMGVIEWFPTGGNQHSFGWVGGHCKLINPLDANLEAGRGYVVPDDYVLIDNNVPEGAKQYIDTQSMSG